MKRARLLWVGLIAVALVWAALLFPGDGCARHPSSTALPENADAPTQKSPEPPPAVEPIQVDEPLEVAPAAPPASAVEPPVEQQAVLDQEPPAEPPGAVGPVAELRQAYAEDSRDPDAGTVERRIRQLFDQEGIPKEMLRSISCAKSVCKLELRWSPENQSFYMIAMMHLINHESEKVAAEPVGGDTGRGQHAIEVYVSRIEPPFEPPK